MDDLVDRVQDNIDWNQIWTSKNEYSQLSLRRTALGPEPFAEIYSNEPSVQLVVITLPHSIFKEFSSINVLTLTFEI